MAEVCSTGTLNIIFHGTFAFVKGAEKFNVLIPDVSDHQFLAGTYLKENELNRGKIYKVVGVAGAAQSPLISTANNICITEMPVVKEASAGNLLFCQWDLPWPDSFRSVRDLAIDDSWFTPADAVAKNITIPERLALVHVLSYRFDHSCSLGISDQNNAGFEWEPHFNPDKKTVNLHIYADPNSRIIDKEKLPAFTKIMNLFGLDVALSPPSSTEPFPEIPDEYPEIPGLEDPDELASYEARSHKENRPPYSCSPSMSLAPPAKATALTYI